MRIQRSAAGSQLCSGSELPLGRLKKIIAPATTKLHGDGGRPSGTHACLVLPPRCVGDTGRSELSCSTWEVAQAK